MLRPVTHTYIYICIHTYRCQHCCKQQWNVAGCRSKVRMRVVATVAAVTHTSNTYRHTDIHTNICVCKLHKRTCRCSIWWQFMSKGNVARKAKSILLVMQLECFVVHWLRLVRFVCLFVCVCKMFAGRLLICWLVCWLHLTQIWLWSRNTFESICVNYVAMDGLKFWLQEIDALI